MDIMVDGVLDQRLMTIAGHLYNVTVRMKFGGSEGRPDRMIQVGKVKSGKFDAVPVASGSALFSVLLFIPQIWRYRDGQHSRGLPKDYQLHLFILE